MAEFPHILASNFLENATVSKEGFEQHPIYKIEYAADLSRMSKWQGGKGSSTQRIAFTPLESTGPADTFVFDRNSDIPGGSAVVKLEYKLSEYGSWQTAQLNPSGAASISKPDPNRIYWMELDPVEAYSWSILLEGMDTSQRAPSIFNVWVGRRIELSFGPYGDFDPYEEEVVGESLHGASGAFQWTQRFRRRVLNAGFENLTQSQYEELGNWWSQAAGKGKNWWWLSFPASEPDDPLYLNCEGHAHRFAITSAMRQGTVEAWEVI